MSIWIVDNVTFIIDDRMKTMVQVRTIWKIVLGILHIIGMSICYDFAFENTIDYRTEYMAMRFAQHITLIDVRCVNVLDFALRTVDLCSNESEKKEQI